MLQAKWEITCRDAVDRDRMVVITEHESAVVIRTPPGEMALLTHLQAERLCLYLWEAVARINVRSGRVTVE